MSRGTGIPLGRLTAEFFVIVVGVLVALGAEAWWSGRQEVELETETLMRIRADIVADENMIRDLQGYVGLASPAARRVPEILESERPMTPSDLAVIYAAALVFTPDRQFSTWDDLLASGQTSVIQDPTLRAALNRYYSEFRDVEALKESLGPDYRTAVLSTLPVEYTRSLLDMCIRDPDRDPGDAAGPHPDGFAAVLACPVESAVGSQAHGRELRSIPGLAGMARLRDYAFGNLDEGVNRTAVARDAALEAVEGVLRDREVPVAPTGR